VPPTVSPARPKRAPKRTAACDATSPITARRRKRDAQDAAHRAWNRAFQKELDAREAEARAHREQAYDHPVNGCYDPLDCECCQAQAWPAGQFWCERRPDGGAP
jgi:hypothetical protein